MECFSILISLCASLAMARGESFSDLPAICFKECSVPPVALNKTQFALDSLKNEPEDLFINSAVVPINGYKKISQFTAICVTNQCVLTWFNIETDVPNMVFSGARDNLGNTGGQLVIGGWYRATGRVSIDPGNYVVVHVQDLYVGQVVDTSGQFTMDGILRNTFRYLNTIDIRGHSISAEVGPEFGIHLLDSSNLLLMTITAGPDLIFVDHLSGTVNFGLRYVP